MVSFKVQPLFSLNKAVSIEQVAVWASQSRSGNLEEERNVLPVPGFKPGLAGHPTKNLVTIPTELSLLPDVALLKNLCDSGYNPNSICHLDSWERLDSTVLHVHFRVIC